MRISLGRSVRRDRNGERGSTLVEAAFVAPVFFLMLFAVFEFGFLFRNSLTTTNASREGARAASVYGAGLQTDFLVLQTVKHGISAQGVEAIEYVVIYTIDSYDDAMNVACHTSSVDDVCNRYTALDMDKAYFQDDGVTPTGHFGCTSAALDRFWCPTDRDAGIDDPPDLVGVYVKTKHTYMTGFIGDETELDAFTVIRIEPEAD